MTPNQSLAIWSPEGRALSAKVSQAVAAGEPVHMNEAEVNLFVQIVVQTQRRDLELLSLADELSRSVGEAITSATDSYAIDRKYWTGLPKASRENMLDKLQAYRAARNEEEPTP